MNTYPAEKLHPKVTVTLDPLLVVNGKAKVYLIKENKWIPIPKEAKLELKNTYGDELKFFIVLDENKDGVWTSGNVEKEIQPEKLHIETITLEAKKKDYILKISNP